MTDARLDNILAAVAKRADSDEVNGEVARLARQDVPELVAEVRRLRAKLAEKPKGKRK